MRAPSISESEHEYSSPVNTETAPVSAVDNMWVLARSVGVQIASEGRHFIEITVPPWPGSADAGLDSGDESAPSVLT